MKRISYFIAWVWVMTVIAGCQRQTESDFFSNSERPQRAITAIAEGGNGTRTMLSAPENGVYHTYWKENDAIGVFAKGARQAEQYTLRSGAGTGVATFAGPELTGRLVGLFPFSDLSEEGLSGDVLSLLLPPVQRYAKESFGDGAYPMLAVSDSSKFEFKNLCAILQLSLLGMDAVESIRFLAHDPQRAVSGKATVRVDFDMVPELSMTPGGSPEVILQCGGVDLDPDTPTPFFLVIPPGLYKGGFEVEIVSKSGRMIRSTDDDVSFERSQYRTIPMFAFVPEAIPVAIPEPVDLGLPSGLKWASFNLGATKPEGTGDYFTWGETEPYYSSLDPLTWKPDKQYGYNWLYYKWAAGSETTLTKYNSDAGYGNNGFTDGKYILEPADDAARVNLGDQWRMPMDYEWEELTRNCTFAWTTQEGVNGCLLTGPNGNSIFLPTTGFLFWNSFSNHDTEGFYWSLTGYQESPTCAYGFWFHSTGPGSCSLERCYGFTIRPVFGERIPVESISLSQTELEMEVGETVCLSATILPEDANDKRVTWSSSDDSVVFVSSHGEVTAFNAGVSTITVTTQDGRKTATCQVTVREAAPYAVPEVVDLGLSVKWASFNLGASKPEEYGDYYAWGETEPHYISQDPLIWKDGKTGYDWDSYKWGMWSGGAVVLTKYSPSADYGYNGYRDGKTVLDPEDDAAHVNLGGNWRMPTWDELNELRTNCSWEWTVKNGVNGRLVTGPNGNSIFLPAASSRYDTVLGNVGLGGYYRSSSLKTDYPTSAYELVFDKYGMYESCSSRSMGFSIRPIYAVGPETKIETNIPTNIGPCSAEIPFTITTTESIFGIGIIYSTNKYDPVVGNLGDGDYSMYYTSDISKSQIIKELKPNTTYYARAFVTVEKEHGPIRYGNTIQFTTKDLSYSTEYVDLGLSVNWATCNLGSISPSNVGGYYGWGETVPTSLRSTYKWSGSEGYTKYNADDGKVTLDASDDAATVNLGSGWRMPTNDEITELRNKCTWTQTTRDGIQGCLVTGPNGKSIFIPVSVGASVFFSADIVSSELNTSYDGYIYAHALSYHFDVSINYYASVFRYSGTPIRPVYDDSGTNPEMSVPEPIDLGLSVKWASFNLGASKPEEFGDYFAWGETETYYSSLDPLTWKDGKEEYGYFWRSYKWSMGDGSTLTKYCNFSESGYNGFMDSKTVLDPEDDAAHVNLGGNWRMPTDDEWTELREKCTWTWTSLNGVTGGIVTGPNGNSIFFPAAGNWFITNFLSVGSGCYFWSSSLNTDGPGNAWHVLFEADEVYRLSYYRFGGQSVRPVCD